jgi:predicted nucleic acid-binding protein
MQKIVIDTNLLTSVFRHNASQILQAIAANASPLIVSVSIHELLRNPYYLDMAKRSQLLARVNKLKASRAITVINPTESDWYNSAFLILNDMKLSPAAYSHEHNTRTNQLRRISFDALILTTAATAGASIVTRNYAEFSRLRTSLSSAQVKIIDAKGIL